MFCQGAIAVIVILAAIHLSPTEAQKGGENVLSKAVDLCKADSERAKLCRRCASTGSGVTETTCCREEAALDRCRHQVESERRKRDADEAGVGDESAAAAAAVLSSLLDGPQVSSRARPFLGKRARYMLGKRLRNNFLGKRSEAGAYGRGSEPLFDDLLEMEQEQQVQQQDAKRARPFLGKKARPFLGKRSDRYGHLAEELGLDELAADVEQEEEAEEEAAEEAAEEAKRARPFLGKRTRRPFLGKRARRPFLGKRDYEQEGDGPAMIDGLQKREDGGEKRARPFLGKRGGGSRPFLGKRQQEEASLIDDDLIKRAARYMLGKRRRDDDDVGVGVDVFADDVEKRRRYMLGKRSADGGHETGDRKSD